MQRYLYLVRVYENPEDSDNDIRGRRVAQNWLDRRLAGTLGPPFTLLRAFHFNA